MPSVSLPTQNPNGDRRIGRSAIDIEGFEEEPHPSIRPEFGCSAIDSEGAIEEPHASNVFELGVSLMSSDEELVALLADLRVLKRRGLDWSRQVEEIRQLRESHAWLRSELDALKRQMDKLATHVGGNPEEINSQAQPLADQFEVGHALPSVLRATELSNDIEDSIESLTEEILSANTLNLMIVQARMEASKYSFTDTTWDAVVFVRMGVLYIIDEIIVCFCGAANVIIQFVFVFLVKNNMMHGRPDFTDEEIVNKLIDWRVESAHDPLYADKFTNTPLAQAICTRDPLIMAGTLQADIFVGIDDYLAETFGFPSGGILCMLAIFLWSCICLREFGKCCGLLQSIWLSAYDSGSSTLTGFKRLLSGRSTIDARHTIRDGVGMVSDVTRKTIVLNIGFQRACVITCCIIFPRFLVLVCLYYVGVWFLIATIELQELILNAVALEVVLHVDEMLYDLFCPARCKCVLSKTRSLRLPKAPVVFDNTTPYLRVFCAATMIVLIRYILLAPVLINLEDSHEAMCGGSLDFLAVVLEVGPVLAGKPLVRKPIDRTAYNYRAILQRTGLKVDEWKSRLGPELWYLNSDASPSLFPIRNVNAAREYADLTVASLTAPERSSTYFRFCLDMSWEHAYPYTRTIISRVLAEATGTVNHSCQALKDHGFCNENSYAGNVQRFFCPQSCEIHNPISGLVYRDAKHGVSTDECDRMMRPLLESQQCEDLPTSHPGFKTFADSLRALLTPIVYRSSAGNKSYQAWVDRAFFDGIKENGCSWASPSRVLYFTIFATGEQVPFNTAMCNPLSISSFGIEGRSLRFLCPVTCGCNSTVKYKYNRSGKIWDFNIGIFENCPKTCFD